MGVAILHLTGKGFSGRVVKLRQLLPSEIDACDKKAAQIISSTHKDLPDEARSIVYRSQSIEEGIATFLVAYTAPLAPSDVCRDPPEAAVAPDATEADIAMAKADRAKALSRAPIDPDKVAKLKWLEAGQTKIASGEIELDAIFTAKDLGVIARQYNKMHFASVEEVEAIEGKGIELSTG